MKYFTLLLLFVLSSCYKQKKICADFKTGKFNFTQEIDGKKETTILERTDKFQIETYKGKTDSASVRWVNDCEFVLEKLHPKNMKEQKAISMRILTTTKNSYTFEYSFVNDENKQLGTVTKIE
ncbi:DNA topoisomerase IV [Flavobacterium sp.]|uniref:DNA topoisomerase IV n=1 Tax=Flavobacterium sp. TaxID=239 RepID=UPI0037515B39